MDIFIEFILIYIYFEIVSIAIIFIVRNFYRKYMKYKVNKEFKKLRNMQDLIHQSKIY